MSEQNVYEHAGRMRKLTRLSEHAKALGFSSNDLRQLDAIERRRFEEDAGVTPSSEITWSSLINGLDMWERAQIALPDDPFSGMGTDNPL